MATALESGKLSWSAVRELTRVAVPETEQAWLDVAPSTEAATRFEGQALGADAVLRAAVALLTAQNEGL